LGQKQLEKNLIQKEQFLEVAQWLLGFTTTVYYYAKIKKIDFQIDSDIMTLYMCCFLF
jgi:hypothetical protein